MLSRRQDDQPPPDFSVVGDLSDAAIEALASLLLAMADADTEETSDA